MWQFQNASKTVTAIFRRRAKKAHPMLNLILWLYNWHGYFGRISRRMCDFFKLFKSIGHIDFWGVPDRWTRCRWAIVQRHPKVSRDVQRYLGESVQRYLMKYVFQKHIFMLNIHQGLHQEKHLFTNLRSTLAISQFVILDREDFVRRRLSWRPLYALEASWSCISSLLMYFLPVHTSLTYWTLSTFALAGSYSLSPIISSWYMLIMPPAVSRTPLI